MEPEELLEFQKIFASINTSDPGELRCWFLSYPELTLAEHSQITGYAKSTITTWRHKAGVFGSRFVELDDCVLGCKTKPPNHRTPCKSLPDIEVPPDWRQKPKWVAACHRELGISKRQLGFLLGCSRNKITKLINRAENPIPQEILDFICAL